MHFVLTIPLDLDGIASYGADRRIKPLRIHNRRGTHSLVLDIKTV